MKPEELTHLGFKFVKEYKHDSFLTKRFKKGVILAELTYKDNELQTFDIEIEEIPLLIVNEKELILLDSILNK